MVTHADVAQLVEHHLAKVRVAGSNPVVRSKRSCRSGALTAPLIRARKVRDFAFGPRVFLAAVIEAVAENLRGDDADVIPLRRDDEQSG